MKRVLVTGDRGYIGAVLVPLLIRNNYEVIGLDTHYFRHTFFNKPTLKYKKITKDIRKIERKDLEKIDSVIHLCALSNDPIGKINPSLTNDINYKSSIRLAEIAKKVGVKRFIFSSSCSVYGGNGEKPVTEKDIVDPLTPYAKSKTNTETVLKEMASDNFSPVLLRNSTVYGYSPKMRMDLVVNNLVAWAITTGKITLLSDGRAWRPLIHVYDLSRIFMLVVQCSKKLIHNQVFNVGSDDQNYLITNIALEINRQLPKCKIVFGNGASADKRNYKVNFQKLKKTFPNFNFEMDVPKGVSELIKIFSDNKLTINEFESKKYIRLKGIRNLLDNRKVDENLYWLIG